MSNGINRDGAAESLLDELELQCDSDSLSEQGLREIIERHGLTPNDHPNVTELYDFFTDACRNPSVNEGIIRYLLEYFPDAASYVDIYDNGWTPLHHLCYNENATLDIFQLLIDAAPESVRRVDDDGSMPLHHLCRNYRMDENEAIEILRLLLEKCPESIRQADIIGQIPLHYAAMLRPPAFCDILIEAHPESERIRSNSGQLALHMACYSRTHHNIEYFYNLYPDAINHASSNGEYPIHCAIQRMTWPNHADTYNVVKFLLDCDASVILQRCQGKSLLHYACGQEYNDSNIGAAIQVIETLYDAHPEAIEGDELISDIQRYHQQVQAFLNRELVYARQANDHRFMTTPDEYGQLPLHRALLNNVRLGSIKLLVRGNLDTTTLCHVDSDGNTALHYACRGAKYDIIAMLLDEYNAASVSTWNVNGKLPIDILFESDEVEDRASIEYIDCVFRLLNANPHGLLTTMKEQTKPENSLSSFVWLTVAVAVASWILLFIYV